jgi:8-oxo-dGTP pyrophosphatase MutT (NUDIX family)
MLNKNSKRIAIGLVTNENDNVLMGKRNDTDKWTMPAGSIEKGECPFMGMIRELKEETGLDAIDIKLVDSQIKGDMLLYLFKIKVDLNQEIDTTNDPDNECDDFSFEDPFDHIEELHVPAEENLALKYWAHN